MGGLRLPEEQESSGRHMPLDGQPGTVQKHGIRPTRNRLCREPVGVFESKAAAGMAQRLWVQVIQPCLRDPAGAPISVPRLPSYCIQLVQPQGGQAFSGAGVVMAFPGDGDAQGGRWYLEEDYPPLRRVEQMNVAKRHPRLRVAGNLVFEPVEPLIVRPVSAAHHTPTFVIHAEDQPTAVLIPKIDLIGQRREILPDVRGRVAARKSTCAFASTADGTAGSW